MKTIRTKSGLYKPVFNAEFEALCHGDNATGLCIKCGNEVDGIEPDAERYRCDQCENETVFGLEQLAVRGWLVQPAS
jgi:hypothetical protein